MSRLNRIISARPASAFERWLGILLFVGLAVYDLWALVVYDTGWVAETIYAAAAVMALYVAYRYWRYT